MDQKYGKAQVEWVIHHDAVRVGLGKGEMTGWVPGGDCTVDALGSRVSSRVGS